jgi:hypothetical protein
VFLPRIGRRDMTPKRRMRQAGPLPGRFVSRRK